MSEATLGGRFTFPGTSLTVQRIGYGAMQLAGPGVWGPPKDPDGAVAVLREAVAAGVEPYRHLRLLRPARHQPDHPAGPAPVPGGAGDRHQARRPPPPDGSWQPAISPEDLTAGVHDNLRNLGLDALDIVNYRAMGAGHGPDGGVHRRAGDGAGRPPAQGADPPHRPEQRHGRPGGRGAGDHRHRVRAEQLQPGPPPRRRPDRRPGPAGHPLRAVLPARRVHAAAVVHPVGRSRAGSGPRRCRSRWRGCCTGRPTSC